MNLRYRIRHGVECLYSVGLAAALLAWAASACAEELLRWERLPLAVPLVVGQERVVFVERNVRVGVPESLNPKLRVQSAAGTVYLKALAPIDPTRIQLQDAESGELILLDIAAKEPEDKTVLLEPIRIVEGKQTARRYGKTSSGKTDSGTGSERALEPPATPRATETPAPVVLTRYAAQSLYAPLRTVEAVPGITRISLRRNLELKSLLPTMPVEARALAAWRLNDYWVSAILLRNTSVTTVMLDPRLLQGDFVTATFQHDYLGPKGDATDTTVAYLVTRQHGLSEALLPAISRIDAAASLKEPAHEK